MLSKHMKAWSLVECMQIGKNKKVTIMNDEYLEEQIVQQIEVLVDELGGTLKQLTRADSTGRMSKVIEIEYDTN